MILLKMSRRYKNAADILPDDLLKQLQQYAAGDILYVPSPEKRKPWGATGTRQFYLQRNEEIRRLYAGRMSIAELAERYGLSAETIRKIIYQ
jgi:Mor family transcriptional regulator